MSEYSGAYCSAGIGAQVATLDADSLERTDKHCTHTYDLRDNNMRDVNDTKVVCEEGGECLSGTCCNSTWIGKRNVLILRKTLFSRRTRSLSTRLRKYKHNSSARRAEFAHWQALYGYEMRRRLFLSLDQGHLCEVLSE